MLRFIAYVRKSQDRSDRQVMSIDGQINEIKRFAKQYGYVIVDIVIEKQSAKKPGRPFFNQMIERIQKGEANGILCWKLNRVARNPVDAGTISWMLQGNVIKAIHSKERSYLPSDNVLMMQIDFGIANQYVKDLSSDVKRGMRDKARNGWCPRSQLPIGYLHSPDTLNDKVQIILDPIRSPIVKELWKHMETGAYTVLDIKRIADEVGLVNKRGKTYATSTFYKMFKNPLYYGKFYWKDENGVPVLWEGKHEPIVSEYVFRKVQKIISLRNRNSGAQKDFFTYRGLIACGGCNGHVSAEKKLQVTCQNCKNKYSIRRNEICPKCDTSLSEMNGVNIIDITYYRCTRNKDKSCRQKAITESKIEQQIMEILKEVNISNEIYNWGLKYIETHFETNSKNEMILEDSLRRKKERISAKMKKLIELRISGEITAPQAAELRDEYQTELEETESKLFAIEHAISIERHESLNYLNFANNCVDRFNGGDQKTKKELTAFFCSNLNLFDKTLYFSTKKTPFVLSSMQNLLLANSLNSNLLFDQITL